MKAAAPMMMSCCQCGKVFKRPSGKLDRKYCSMACRDMGMRRLPDRTCKQCGVVFRPGNHRQFCCGKQCAMKWIARHRKSYKGRTRTTKGYVLVWSPDHPSAQAKNGYVMEHRLVMEKSLGRYLKRSEVVHHVNGVKDDNRLSNLVLMDKRRHDAAKRPVYMVTCPCCKHVFPMKGNAHTVQRR